MTLKMRLPLALTHPFPGRPRPTFMQDINGENGTSRAQTSVLFFGLNIWAAKAVPSTFGVPAVVGIPNAIFVPFLVPSTLLNILAPTAAKLAVGLPNTHRLQPPNRAPIPDKDTLIPVPNPEVAVFASYVEVSGIAIPPLADRRTPGSARPTPSWPGPTALTCRFPRKAAFFIPTHVP